jgi:5'-3' exoribonuclease 2
MGVPQFYKFLKDAFGDDLELWIHDRRICHEDIHKMYSEFKETNVEGCNWYKNTSDEAPYRDYDCLYLDMNGIIHPCAHPESGPAPTDEEEMLFNVMMYLDRLVYAIRPKSLLYLSVDGCAPRAKMNQQRGRRFISAKDSQISRHIHTAHFEYYNERIKKMLNVASDDKEFNIRNVYHEIFQEKKPSWDHNVITPGTEFMDKITNILHFYAAFKINTDPLFKDLKIIVSDASNPGEGEHKIINYIRQQRNDPNYSPDTKHIIHALDADLLFLSLLTHEINIYVLREDNMRDVVPSLQRDLIIVQIPTLRKLLAKEMAKSAADKNPQQAALLNYENLVDDFVFLCILCGNDFLPNVPGLSIKEGSIPYLMGKFLEFCVHRNEFYGAPYLTSGTNVNINNFVHFMKTVADDTDSFYLSTFKKAKQTFDNEANCAKKFIKGQQIIGFENKIFVKEIDYIVQKYREHVKSGKEPIPELTLEEVEEILAKEQEENEEKEQDKNEEENGESTPESQKPDFCSPANMLKNLQKKLTRQIEVASNHYMRRVVLHEKQFSKEFFDKAEGWKDEYYRLKFEIPTVATTEPIVKGIVKDYIQGLVFVWKYYAVGTPSWTWYYPHHFAPLASDFQDFNEPLEPFKLGAPNRPFSQLMSVMPKKSSGCLPKAYQDLMHNSTRIAPFYPDEFRRDQDGKGIAWKAVPLLPFIDDKVLKEEIATIKDVISNEEKRRNSFGHTILYFNKDSVANRELSETYDKVISSNKHIITKHSFTVALHASHYFTLGKKFSGYLYNMQQYPKQCREIQYGKPLPESPIKEYFGSVQVAENKVAMCVYYPPAFPLDLTGKIHHSLVGSSFDLNKVVKDFLKEAKKGKGRPSQNRRVGKVNPNKRKAQPDFEYERPNKRKRNYDNKPENYNTPIRKKK